jgi:hypothetical protein
MSVAALQISEWGPNIKNIMKSLRGGENHKFVLGGPIDRNGPIISYTMVYRSGVQLLKILRFALTFRLFWVCKLEDEFNN